MHELGDIDIREGEASGTYIAESTCSCGKGYMSTDYTSEDAQYNLLRLHASVCLKERK